MFGQLDYLPGTCSMAGYKVLVLIHIHNNSLHVASTGNPTFMQPDCMYVLEY